MPGWVVYQVLCTSAARAQQQQQQLWEAAQQLRVCLLSIHCVPYRRQTGLSAAFRIGVIQAYLPCSV